MITDSKAQPNPIKPKIQAENWLSQYGDDLFRFAVLRVRDSQIAEEMVQDTFVSAYASRASFEGRSSEKTWLIGILKRKIYEYMRRRHREQPLPEEWPEPDRAFAPNGHWDLQSGLAPRDWGDPDELLSRQDLRRALHQCILGLPPRFGDVFVLREFEEMDTGEICRILEITPENCWVILHRGRMQLRSCLERAGFGKP